MDYEKKYKDALEWAKQVYKTPYTAHWDVMKELIEHLFPELKESEDEKVIKWLTDLLNTMQYHHCDEDMEMGNKAIAWLEKQGEQNVPSREMVLNVWKLGNIWKEITKGVCNTEHGTQLEFIIKHWNEGEHYTEWLEKQGEQKPITDFSNLRILKYIVDAVLTEKEGIGQYLDSPFTEELAKKLQERFGNIEQIPTGWSEEDEERYLSCLKRLSTGDIRQPETINTVWLKSLKDRIK